MFEYRFEKYRLVNNDSLLLVRDPAIVQPRGRPQGSENRRQQAFETSTLRQPSLFERVEAQTAYKQGGEVAPEIENTLNRADPAPGRGWGRGRIRGRP